MFKTKSESQPCDLVEYKFNNKPYQFRQAEDTLWLTQNKIAQLFETDRSSISKHLQNIFKEGELDKKVVVKDFLITANNGKQYNVKHYNLDTVISVGYRVRSPRGTQFGQWANEIIKNHIKKSYEEKNEQMRKDINEPVTLSFERFLRIKESLNAKNISLRGAAKVLGISTAYFCDCLKGYRYNPIVEKWANNFLKEYAGEEEFFLGISAREKDRMIGKVAKLTRNSLCGDLAAYKKIKVFFDYVGHSLLNELEENLGTRQRIELIEE
ncbi:MAG: virulence RhuM family protein [Candidatus Gastranaerophilales bacterium]|nr:virulence RhuM family protein [Candidatus Gastranaerophilales bacterium]